MNPETIAKINRWNSHLVAIPTYGAQVQKYQNKRVSCQKIGDVAALMVLLKLGAGTVINTTTRAQTYQYPYIRPYLSDKEPVNVLKGYFLLRLLDHEVNQIFDIVKPSTYHHVSTWKDGTWQLFPNKTIAFFRDGDKYSVPDYEGTGRMCRWFGFGLAQPLVIETEQGREGETLHWISGGIYPHMDTLSSLGASWSKYRKSFFTVGDPSDKLCDFIQSVNDAFEPVPVTYEQPKPEKKPENPQPTLF